MTFDISKRFSLGLLLLLLIIVTGCGLPTSVAEPMETPTAEATNEPVVAEVAEETAVVEPSATPTAPTEETAQEPEPTVEAVQESEPVEEANATPEPVVKAAPTVIGMSRGYLTTPQELVEIMAKAESGLEPYASAVSNVLEWAEKDWDFNKLEQDQNCKDSETPGWNDNNEGTPILYGKALAYHLTGNQQYAEDVKNALQRIMTEVEAIKLDEQQCRLNFGWGTPELVASADLIEEYWRDMDCSGPESTIFDENALTIDNCKRLFQNWLVKNPYYVVSYTAVDAQSNWGSAATNATAYIADYLWDRPEVTLLHRNPEQVNDGEELEFTPAEAFAYANQLAMNRLNGYGIEYHSSKSCDYLDHQQQDEAFDPVKSQITENGIIPEDARREEFCNVPAYNGEYQNYPQLHIGNTLQQCELMLRRGDNSCYENVDNTDIPDFTYVDAKGETRVTHLRPGRGSLERAINAIIVDAKTIWKRDAALSVAYRYYVNHHRLPGIQYWYQQFDLVDDCSHDICFGRLTHGFAPGEEIGLPPVVPSS